MARTPPHMTHVPGITLNTTPKAEEEVCFFAFQWFVSHLHYVGHFAGEAW